MLIPNEKFKTLFKPLDKIVPPAPPFKLTVPLNNGYNKQDLLDVLVKVTPAAQVLFIELKNNYTSEVGICSYPILDRIRDTSSSSYQIFYRYIKQLKDAKIIVPVIKRYQRKYQLVPDNKYFMINPSLIKCINLDEAKELWKELSK